MFGNHLQIVRAANVSRTILKIAGFFFIPEALTRVEQLYWATQCLTTFPQPPNRTNHNAMYGPVANLWAAFQENKVLVEIASDKHECNSVSSLIETDSTSTSQRVGEEVSEEVMAEERNRSCDDGTTTAEVGNENGYISLMTYTLLAK